MTSLADELSPIYVGGSAIKLSLALPLVKPRAFEIVAVLVDYSAALPEGIRLPLEFLAVAPTASNFRRQMFRRFAPSTLFFRPTEGGKFSLVLREPVGMHNAWRGALVVDVVGDDLNPLQ